MSKENAAIIWEIFDISGALAKEIHMNDSLTDSELVSMAKELVNNGMNLFKASPASLFFLT